MNFFLVLFGSFFVGDVIWLLKVRQMVRRPRARLWVYAFFAWQLGGLLWVMADRVHVLEIPDALARPFLAAIFLWHLIVMPLAGIGWLLFVLVWLLGRLVGRKAESVVEEKGMSRREFLAAAPVVLTLTGTLAAQPQLDSFRVRRMELPLATLPPALDGMTIAHVTDLHLGRFTHGAVVRAIAEATNALKADLVLMTGDLINYDLRDLPAALDFVKLLRGGPGPIMCVGNHDLIEDGAAFIRDTRASGVPLLVGGAQTVEVRGARVQILGADWGHGDAGHQEAMAVLTPALDAEAFPILLAHHPHVFDFAPQIPLTLAGHTHGGQLMLTERLGFGPAFFRYWSGVYRKEGRTLVVSNGVGNWFPLRINAPAEILHLTLRRG